MIRTKGIFRILLVSLFSIILFFISSGSEDSTQNPSLYSQALIVVPNATKVHYAKVSGTDQVAYQVKEDYPATKTISEISAKLEKAGWQSLEKDFLNPGMPSSSVKGWREFTDSTKKPNIIVHQWIAQWQDKQSNIVWYTLQYTYPTQDKSNLSILKVNAIFIPAAQAKLMLEETKKNIKNLK